jgi:hypothetical protein
MILVGLLFGGLVGVCNPMLYAWIASYFLSDDKANIAGFSFALGSFIACFGFVKTSYPELWAFPIGVFLGLTVAWMRFFRTRELNG